MPHTTPLIKYTFNYEDLECAVPRVPIRFISKKGKSTRIIFGVLDSGADEITIPKDLAIYLELDLKLREKPINTAMGEKEAYSGNLNLVLFRSREVKYEDIEVCVIEGCPAILVGIEPIFKDFNVTISASKKKVFFEPYNNKKK